MATNGKSVIYLTYSQVNPVAAAQLSSSSMSWDIKTPLGISFAFLSTRPGASNVCASAPSNPIGTFYIQSVTNAYVTAFTLPGLIASSASQSPAAKLQLAFAPNAGTVKAIPTNQFVRGQ